jgi:hypothetical protein
MRVRKEVDANKLSSLLEYVSKNLSLSLKIEELKSKDAIDFNTIEFTETDRLFINKTVCYKMINDKLVLSNPINYMKFSIDKFFESFLTFMESVEYEINNESMRSIIYELSNFRKQEIESLQSQWKIVAEQFFAVQNLASLDALNNLLHDIHTSVYLTVPTAYSYAHKKLQEIKKVLELESNHSSNMDLIWIEYWIQHTASVDYLVLFFTVHLKDYQEKYIKEVLEVNRYINNSKRYSTFTDLFDAHHMIISWIKRDSEQYEECFKKSSFVANRVAKLNQAEDPFSIYHGGACGGYAGYIAYQILNYGDSILDLTYNHIVEALQIYHNSFGNDLFKKTYILKEKLSTDQNSLNELIYSIVSAVMSNTDSARCSFLLSIDPLHKDSIGHFISFTIKNDEFYLADSLSGVYKFADIRLFCNFIRWYMEKMHYNTLYSTYSLTNIPYLNIDFPVPENLPVIAMGHKYAFEPKRDDGTMSWIYDRVCEVKTAFNILSAPEVKQKEKPESTKTSFLRSWV